MVSNVKKVLDMGYARGVSIDLCLLSFDMMKTDKSNVDMEAKKMILQTDAGRKALSLNGETLYGKPIIVLKRNG
jgi:hypothetical protein